MKLLGHGREQAWDKHGLFFSVLHRSQPHLDQERDRMPEADPGEDTVSNCALQRGLQEAAGIYFSPPSVIHRQFLLGFISGASLLPRPFFLTLRSWSSDARLKQGNEMLCHPSRSWQ